MGSLRIRMQQRLAIDPQPDHGRSRLAHPHDGIADRLAAVEAAAYRMFAHQQRLAIWTHSLPTGMQQILANLRSGEQPKLDETLSALATAAAGR